MNYLDLSTQGAKAGTGPYYIDSVNPTTYEVVLKANSNYWGGSKNWNGPPISVSIKTVDYLYAPDLARRILDLRAGTASGIQLSSSDLFSVADRDQWINNGTLVSLMPGVTLYGPFPTLHTFFMAFETNVTDSAGRLHTFQPFADVRFRLAAASAINLTDTNININNRLGLLTTELVTPGIAPVGTFNPDIKPPSSFDLNKTEQLLLDAQKHPLTNFVDANGHAYAPGTIDNSFSSTNPRTIIFYAAQGDTVNQKMVATILSNLNQISVKDGLGLTFTLAVEPTGQLLTLASEHQADMYEICWLADYAQVMDYILGGFCPSGFAPLWDNFNLTALGNLCSQAIQADRSGDVQSLVRIHNEIETVANQAAMYIYPFIEIQFDVRTSFLRGYYFNPAFGQYLACLYYQTA